MATTIRVYIDGGGTPAATGPMQPDRTFSVPVAGVADGVHSIEVTAQEDGKGESARVIQTVTVAHGTTQHPLVGSVTGAGAVLADLAAPGAPPSHPLAGDVTGTGSASADLIAYQIHALTGSAAGTGATAADLTAPGPAGSGFSDNFNRANGSPADGSHPWVVSEGSPLISANSVSANDDAAGMYWNAVVANDQYAEVKATPSYFGSAPPWSHGTGPRVRESSATAYYALEAWSYEDEGVIGPFLRLYKRTGATAQTQLASYDAHAAKPYLRIEVSGNQITCKAKQNAGDGWTTLGTAVTDSSYASGNVGLSLPAGLVDDFAGGAL
jgi:hypothetical protein